MQNARPHLVRVGRRVDYDLDTFKIHNGLMVVDLTASEFADWLTARYTDKLADTGLITDNDEGIIPVRNGILMDLKDTEYPEIWGIVAENQQSVGLTIEELSLWKQADGINLLQNMTERSWALVSRLVSAGVWTLRWSREVLQ